MQVSIKSFDVNMEVKSKGIEFEIYDTQDVFKGDCILSMTGLVWCRGKTSRGKGQKIPWSDFIALMENPDTLKEAIKQARKSPTSQALGE